MAEVTLLLCFAKMIGGKTESGSLIHVADLIGYVRETNYGKWFEVRSKIDAINLAYTNLGIELHTDNPYRDPIPTIQITLLSRKFCKRRRFGGCRWFLRRSTS